jgi:hypothetical protein
MILSIKLIKDGYHSMSTVSCFASFTLLVLMKLYNSFVVSHASIKSDKMMSAYMCEFVSYNVLDSDYIKEKNNRIELGEEKDEIKEQLKDNIINEEEIIPIIKE